MPGFHSVLCLVLIACDCFSKRTEQQIASESLFAHPLTMFCCVDALYSRLKFSNFLLSGTPLTMRQKKKIIPRTPIYVIFLQIKYISTFIHQLPINQSKGSWNQLTRSFFLYIYIFCILKGKSYSSSSTSTVS